MPTIKDIAQLAGVSHGTVSNVLNKRGNVSIEKINLVENAARALGYQRNAQAQQLRKGRNKFVAVIIPDFNQKTYLDLYTSLDQTLRKDGYSTNLYLTKNIHHYEEIILEQVVALNPDTIVVVSSLLKNNGVFDDKNNFIFIDRYVEGMPDNALFVSFDFYKAGFEIGQKIIRAGHTHVALFSGDDEYSNEQEFHKGLAEAFEITNGSLSLFSGSYSLAFSTSFDILSKDKPFDAIVLTNPESLVYLRSAISCDPNLKLPEVFTISSTEILPGHGLNNYELNYKLLGKKIGQFILKSGEEEVLDESHFDLPNDGFKFTLPDVQIKKASGHLNFLTLTSPTSEALRKILPSYTLQSGVTVELTELDYNELYNTARLLTNGSFYDLIRIDLLWLSELGEKLFTPLDAVSADIRSMLAQFSPSISTEYSHIGERIYSLPFDPSVQMLYFREDLFEDAKVKREFYEQHKRQLRAPQSIEEYLEVARFFTKKFNPNSPTEYGASLVFGMTTAAADFLPWFKGLGGEILDASGQVHIHTPLARQALTNYVEMLKYCEPATNLWWRKVLEKFAEGNTAMVTSFSNHASNMVLSKGSKVVGKIGYAVLPGGRPLLGGGVVGISKDSQKTQECIEFLKWIYQPNVAAIIAYLGGYSPSKNLYENEDLLTLYPWIRGIDEGFRIGHRRNTSASNPRYSDVKFEAVLGMAVRNAATGIVDVDTALSGAQKQLDFEFKNVASQE
jgi:multiple sugar transport system substrate-binding protein